MSQPAHAGLGRSFPDPYDYLGTPIVEVVVFGDPAPQGSKRHVGGGRMIEMSKKVKPWRVRVEDAARAVVGDDFTPVDGPIVASMVFTLSPPPVRAPRWWTLPGPWLWPLPPPDLSKLIRSTEDALSPRKPSTKPRATVRERSAWSGVWKDDSRVVEYAVAAKRYPNSGTGALDQPGAVIAIWMHPDVPGGHDV